MNGPHRTNPTAGSVVIIGAGHAGIALAANLRQRDFDGRIIVFSSDRDMPYQRPPLSKRFLGKDYWQELRPPAFYEEQRIDLRLDTRVRRIDPRNRTVVTDDGEVGYWRLVIATGATPRRLAVPGAGLSCVLDLRNRIDAEALRREVIPGRRLAIVGGGYIGLEVAAQATARGIDVTIVERETRLLSRVASEEFAEALASLHRADGTRILTNAQVTGFSAGREDVVAAVELAGDATIECDVVIVGAGALPLDELAVSAGIDCNGGIIVDDEARTSEPDIYAVGDVTCRPVRGGSTSQRLESIPSAVEQANCAAASITGADPPGSEITWFWSDQYDLRLKVAGIVKPVGPGITRGDIATRKFGILHLDHEDVVTSVETANWPALFVAGKKLIADRTRMRRSALSDSAMALSDCSIRAS